MAARKVASKKSATTATKKKSTERAAGKVAKPKAPGKTTRPKASRTPSKPAPKKKVASAKAKGTSSTRKKAGAKAAGRGSRRSTSAKARKSSPQRKRELGPLRERLRGEHGDLMQAYLNAKGDTRERQGDGTEDYIDYAVSSYDREFMLSLTETQQRQLQLIEDALHRIDRGEYGHCMQCDKEIPAKRLEVQPWAQFCVACQELADQGLLQPRPLEDSDEDDLEDDEEAEEIEGEIEIDDKLAGDEKNADGSDTGDDEEEETLGL